MTSHTRIRAALASALTAGLLVAAVTPADASARATFGPVGYGGVKLGMSAKAAKATGKVVRKRGPASLTCTGWDLKAHPTGRNRVGLYISKKHGVALISAPKGVRTPRGIGLGSTRAQLKKAYPGLKTAASGFPYVSVPGNRKARYLFLVNSKGKIYELSLVLTNQDCVN